MTGDTIAAIGTPPGGAMRALVRLSGPRTAAILAELWRVLERRCALEC
ncbi:MAG: hypothetical protein IPJ19_12475 [Planctomycetes bacterium]|nr:hypothetical protein [Planctomycetota bacterium]